MKCLTRRQAMPMAARVARMVSPLTCVAVIPCSKHACASKSSVHRLVSYPRSRNCSRAASSSARRSVGLPLAFGLRQLSPSRSKAWIACRTACPFQALAQHLAFFICQFSGIYWFHLSMLTRFSLFTQLLYSELALGRGSPGVTLPDDVTWLVGGCPTSHRVL